HKHPRPTNNIKTPAPRTCLYLIYVILGAKIGAESRIVCGLGCGVHGRPSFFFAGLQKTLDKRMYMCIVVYIHHEAHRDHRRPERLVPAGSPATVAAGFGVVVAAAWAVHPRELFNLRVGTRACQLRPVGTDGKTADVAVCARRVGSRGPTGGRAWAAVAGVDARGKSALPGSLEARTGLGPSVSEKGGVRMIEPRYRQQTLYEQAVETFMADHKKLLWEDWMRKVDE